MRTVPAVLFRLLSGVSFLLLASFSIPELAPVLGEMKLLEGYVNQPSQGNDTKVGIISKKDGLIIHYEVSRVRPPGAPESGRDFVDGAKNAPKEEVRRYREHSTSAGTVHIAYRKDDTLLVSYPETGVNFQVIVKSPEKMADALLMILTHSAK